MTILEENKKGTGIVWFFVSMPLSLKLSFLVLLTLLTRILVFIQPQIITIDGTLYIKMAKLFAEGKYGGISGTYFNLYPLLMFYVQKFVGDWELSGQLISIVLGTLTVVPVFLLGRSLYNEKIGWLSALFYITLPNLLKFDTQVIRDPTSWFFILMTLWLAWEGLKKNKIGFFGLASISAGLATITRIDGLILWGALGVFIALQRMTKISLRNRVLNISFLIILFPLLLSAILFCIKTSSNPTAIHEMFSFPLNAVKSNASVIFKPQDPIGAMSEKTYNSLPVISQDSLELANRHRIVLSTFEVLYKFIKSANFLIILILVGFWKRKKEKMGCSDLYLLYVFLILFATSLFYTYRIYYFSTRHGLTLVLPVLFFAGHGVEVVAERFSRRLNRFASGWFFLKGHVPQLITVLLIILFLVQGFSVKGTEKVPLKKIGLWLKANGHQGSVIMGAKRFLRLAFYAEGEFVEIPDTWEKAIESIRQNQVSIMVIDSCTIEQECLGFSVNRPDARFLPLQGPKRKEERCKIEIFRVY